MLAIVRGALIQSLGPVLRKDSVQAKIPPEWA